MTELNEAIKAYWAKHPDFAAEAEAEGVDTRNGHLPVRGLMFDMDGVLFDSMPYHAKSWSRVCSEFGLKITEEDVYLNEGRTGVSTLNWLAQNQWGRKTTEEEAERMYEEKCNAFNSFPPAPKMPGAETLLSQIKASGRILTVVTGSGQASLLTRLTTNYPGFFHEDLIVSSRDVRHGKPNPEPYLIGLRKMNLRPWEAIVVENAPLGVRAGVAANVFTIAANTGPLADHFLLDEGADFLFPSMQAFSDAWETMTKQL